METIFKKGDKVFCILYGHGTVLSIGPSDSYPIVVLFESGIEEVYTINGSYDNNITPTLSFTEYTLERFSQERPERLPNRGDVCWVRDSKNDEWDIMHFVEYVKDATYPYRVGPSPKKILNREVYKFLTTTNPYANEHN